ncbi:MAG TPA: ABC transporter ATP-binding protein [Candidatus Binatia bacterium]|nr:ABC transporter ATP-binding protein [Candidatus Binatia bacterium]
METTPAIRCRALVKDYGEVRAVNGLELEVQMGECFGLLGPNGAGKTTTVEILEGLLQPTAGAVELLGRTWQTDADWLRQRLGISLQETNLADKLTVEETLRLFRSFYAAGPEVDELLELVSLTDKRRAWYSKLSGGQKQRLAVACALVGDPEVLFLDEPTSGLDPQSRRQLWGLIEGFKSDGRTVLLTTHYMDEAQRLCDRVAIIDRGKVITLGTPRELIQSLGGTEVVEFTCDQPVEESSVRALPGVHAVKGRSDGLSLTVEQLHKTLPLLVAHLQQTGRTLTGLSTHHATLEDVFVNLTGRQLRD